MSHLTRVYITDGRVAVYGHDPKSVVGTVEIYVPMPNDFNIAKKPYLWDFAGLSWIPDQVAIDAKKAKIALKDKKVNDGLQSNSLTQALLDDPLTNWNDPDGDILKSLVVLANKLTVDVR
jgi:hypothetical protein